ncbi:MAG: T9SS type B sorting domain-containing protein [Sphingobacteriales bacterium]|nr:MAG: T9SS type B sorting domain-containing protein [Sphingobacteriales bacterium]
MKRKLSFRVLVAILLGCGALSAKAQIQTNYVPPTAANQALAIGEVNAGTTPDTPGFNTFSVVNNNTYPIAVVDVGYWHVSESPNTARPYNANGNFYSVWVKKNPGPGAPTPINTLNGWNTISTFGPVSTATNGSISITPGVNVIVPPGKKYQFAVVTDGRPIVASYVSTVPPVGNLVANPQPLSFSGTGPEAGVDFITSAALGEYWGSYPNVPFNALFSNGGFIGYVGFVTVQKSAPEPPTVVATPNPACDGDDVTLTATAPSYVTSPIFNWKDPNGTPIGTGASITITGATASQSGKYTVTVTDGTLTSEPAEINVTILKTVAPTVTGQTAYCVNDQFFPVSTNGQNVKWFTNPFGGIGTIIPPYVNTSVAGSYTFYASQTISGCESELTPVTITVAPKPNAPGVTSPIGICEGATPEQLTAIGQNLKWYYQPSGGVAAVVPPTFSTGKLDTFSFWVSQTVDGCEGPRARLDAIVTFKPNGQINIDMDSICQKQTAIISYYGSGLPESAYNWNLPALGATLLSGTKEGPLTVQFDSAGIQTISLLVGNLGCYSDVYTKKIKVNKIPDAGIITKDDICKNAPELVGLYQFDPNIDTFEWDFDGGVVSHYATDQGPYAVQWSTPGQKVVSLLITERLCRAIKRDTLMVHELPDAKFSIEGYREGEQICEGDSIRIAARTIEPASQYVWTPTRFFDMYDKMPVTYSRIDFNSMVKLHVTDEYGCKNADSVRVVTKSCCTLNFPSAFSPNGDGKNDVFRMITPGFNDIKTLRVVNRWGQVVFETADARRGWDGTLNGEPADLGTYFYYINYRCNQKLTEQRGEVTLVR